MLGKENTGKQVAGNQMDYVANESATVDYEDRLSEDISNGTWHSTLDDAASDEVMKKATFFVETFVKKFEEKLSECSKEAKPDSKTRKPGKMLTHVNSIVNNAIPPSPLKLGICKISEGIGFFAAKKHKNRAKKVFGAFVPLEDQIREVLVEAPKKLLELTHLFLPGYSQIQKLFYSDFSSLCLDKVFRKNQFLFRHTLVHTLAYCKRYMLISLP